MRRTRKSAQVHKDLLKRGVPTAYHVVKDITHYGICREGFAEATKIEIDWLEMHLKASPSTPKIDK
jgi:hypothetical protein